jgi:asparagine synthase (glutamine-hydrolysing)
MCGIAGVFSPSGIDCSELERMGAALAHRGPDDSAVWIDQQAGIGLAHRRLAILDLTPAGRQPMVSADGRYVMVCNGEIYNHPELRREIEQARQVAWRGHCDSETLVEAIALWGLQPALERCVGMFALGLWDHQRRELSLARDRFGEKPLYLGYVGGDFAFASELRAIARLPGFERPIDRHALAQFAARGYIPSPRSIFEGIQKLEPASTVTLAMPDLLDRQLPKPVPYWSYQAVVEAGHAAPLASEAEALELLEATLAQAVREQSIADVPVGLFLSGGIDSSTLLALHQAHGTGTMRTYSVGFADARYDESPHARAVAAHFGTEHHEVRFDSADALAVIPRMSAIYDEPFGDPAGIPTFLISRFARADVTVALSGDGGDELFAGYSRYRTAANLWRGVRRAPAPARKAIGKALHAVPPGLWDRLAPGRAAGARLQRTFHRLANADGLADVYRSFRDEWAAHRSPVLGACTGAATDDMDLGDERLPAITRMMLCDATSYLPGDLLCKVDRATMANSLEARVPFLDHRVAQVASRIPLSMMVECRTGKAILRKLLYRHAPRALFERPKAGFTVPVGEWLRGPLKSWAEDLLSHDRLRREGYFDADRIGQLWQAHKLRRVDAGLALWAILMFQAWANNATDLGILCGY